MGLLGIASVAAFTSIILFCCRFFPRDILSRKIHATWTIDPKLMQDLLNCFEIFFANTSLYKGIWEAEVLCAFLLYD